MKLPERPVDRLAIALAISFIVLGSFIVLYGRAGGLGNPLDGRYFYSAQAAREYLAGLSEAARMIYMRVEILDFGLIVIYSSLLVRLLHRMKAGAPIRWIGLLPGFFDILENTTILRALGRTGFDVPDSLGYFTAVKWTAAAAVLLFIALSAGFNRAGRRG
jgi:hypothetical protein